MDTLNNIQQSFRQAAQSLEDRHGSSAIIVALVVTNLIVFCSAWVYWFSRKSPRPITVDKNRDANNTKSSASSLSSFSTPSKQSGCDKTGDENGLNGGEQQQTSQEPTQQHEGQPQKLRNVFSVKQGPPIKATTSSKKSKQEPTERPFGSSYYYAHNNPNSKGGYKDGLRAEDYVMNGPRLLSKGGVRVDVEKSSSSIHSSGDCGGNDDFGKDTTEKSQSSHDQNDDVDVQQQQPLQLQRSQQKPRIKSTISTPITRYLWDDDATGNIAKIHIDTLPVSTTTTIPWQDAGITKDCVEARLLGEDNDGLFVAIRQPQPSIQSGNERKYHLHVPKMYKTAESVKVIVKKHKLIVKITKSSVKRRPRSNRGNSEGMWEKFSGVLGSFAKKEVEEEYISVAWPRLSAASTTKSARDGVMDEIDEKMFKEMDWKGGEDVDF
ncbi:hypothetical protein ACHAXS_008878 [Conticribra weissflogii]